jgi:isocitrate/methylisocitrate lyase
MSAEIEILELDHEWRTHPRWARVARPYHAADVVRLRGSLRLERTPAQLGAEKLWERLHSGRQVHALGALTGDQGVQMARAGLQAIYVPGWHVGPDAREGGAAAPEPGADPSWRVPSLVRRIRVCLERAGDIHRALGRGGIDWQPSIAADAEGGCGEGLDTFERMKRMIGAGAACVRFGDRLPSARGPGSPRGKVLAPVQEVVQKLVAARFAADLLGAPTILVARTDALGAGLLAGDAGPGTRLAGERAEEGLLPARGGMEEAVARALAYAPYADVLWCETARPDLEEARRFARGVHAKLPGKLLAYDCSPSFDWRAHLDVVAAPAFQRELASLGYRFQLVTLAGFHALDGAMLDLASRYRAEGLRAFARTRGKAVAPPERGHAPVSPLEPAAPRLRLVAG